MANGQRSIAWWVNWICSERIKWNVGSSGPAGKTRGKAIANRLIPTQQQNQNHPNLYGADSRRMDRMWMTSSRATRQTNPIIPHTG